MNRNNAIALVVIGSVLVLYVAYQLDQPPPPQRPPQTIEEMRAARLAQEQAQREAFARDGREAIERARQASIAGDHRAAIEILQPFGAALDAEANAVMRLAQRRVAEQEAREAEAREAALQAERARAEREAAAERAAEAALKEIEARIGLRPFRLFSQGYDEVEAYLEARAHDPDSLSFEACTAAQPRDDGWHTTCAYRARNAFGALRLEQAEFVIRDGRVVRFTPID